MRKSLMFGFTFLCCVALTGCGSNRREGIVATTVNTLQDAASKVALIRDEVNAAVKATDEAKEKDKDATIDFARALVNVDSLKVVGKELQAQKREADDFKELPTPEEQNRLKTQYKEKLNAAFKRLTDEKKSLNDALDAAEKSYKDEVIGLRAKIREAEGEFEVLTRR